MCIRDSVYTQREDAVYQHLYLGNSASFRTSKGEASLRCVSEMPWEGRAEITYQGPAGVSLFLRIPAYAENFCIRRNGEKAEFSVEKGYAHLTPAEGDCFQVSFDMPAQYVQANPRAVSYTHLDVYKRQRGSSTSWPTPGDIPPT